MRLQLLDYLSQVNQTPSQSVEFVTYHYIHLPSADECHDLIETLATRLGTRCGIGDPANIRPAPPFAVIFQLSSLAIVRLLVGRDTEVSGNFHFEESLKICHKLLGGAEARRIQTAFQDGETRSNSHIAAWSLWMHRSCSSKSHVHLPVTPKVFSIAALGTSISAVRSSP